MFDSNKPSLLVLDVSCRALSLAFVEKRSKSACTDLRASMSGFACGERPLDCTQRSSNCRRGSLMGGRLGGVGGYIHSSSVDESSSMSSVTDEGVWGLRLPWAS